MGLFLEYGYTSFNKYGEELCGDMVSIVKRDEYTTLVLADGMGSGDDAEKISTVALSLIESFYKAGLSSNLILNTVNKILSINNIPNNTSKML